MASSARAAAPGAGATTRPPGARPVRAVCPRPAAPSVRAALWGAAATARAAAPEQVVRRREPLGRRWRDRRGGRGRARRKRRRGSGRTRRRGALGAWRRGWFRHCRDAGHRRDYRRGRQRQHCVAKKFWGTSPRAGRCARTSPRTGTRSRRRTRGNGARSKGRAKLNWAGLDRVHDYAKQHNIPFKQHNFVWGASNRAGSAACRRPIRRAEVEEWIRLFCERYPDTQLIDVVNEPPPHTTPLVHGGARRRGHERLRLDRSDVQVGAPVLPERDR